MTDKRKELELRRELAADDLRVGRTQVEVAAKYHVSRTSVSRWAKMLRDGRSLESRKATGRPRRLNANQYAALRKHLSSNLDESVDKTKKWIQKHFGITYHSDHLYRMMAQMGIDRKSMAR